MKYSKGMLYGVLGLILAHPAYANLDCVEQPTCSELGYSNTESCITGGFIVCPFDPTYKKCVPERPDCEALGFTDTNKSTWCEGENLIKCPTDTSYTLCAWHSFEEGCDASGYRTIDSNLLCTDEFVELPLSDGTTVTCARECYTSCLIAGYDRDITDVSSDVYCKGGTRTLYRHINDNIDDSTSVVCGKDCDQVYSTCEDANLIDPMYCHVTDSKYAKTIYTSDAGTSKTCYTECTQYAQCSHIGPGYYSSVPSGKTCSSADYTLSDGTKKECYYNCKAVTPDTSRCSEDKQSCYEDCAGISDASAKTTCEGHCDNDYRQCIGNTAYLLFDDLAKIKLTSVSEEFAKEKYVDALEFNEEDCTVYDS